MEIRLRIDDLRAREAMQKYPDKMERATRAGIEDATALLLREYQTYPEQRPEAEYVRTYTFGRSWDRSKVMGSGTDLWATVGSNGGIAPYNIWVMDEERQAAVHADTWRPAQATARDRQGDIAAMFQARVRAEL